MKTISWKRFQAALENKERVLITSHVNPDGDALGSELAAAELVESFGCKAKIYNVSPTPGNLTFLDPRGKLFRPWTPRCTASWIRKNFDAVLVVDTSSRSQLDKAADPIVDSGVPLIIVDHHTVGDSFNALLFSNPEADSTGLLIAQAFDKLKVPMSPAAAQALFTAICTDTGWFRFPSVTSATFSVTAKLVAAGAVPSVLYASLFEKFPFARLKMMGVYMNNAQQYFDGKVILTFAKRSDFERYNAKQSDLEGVINQFLTVAGVHVAVLLSEQISTDGKPYVKANFRSKSDYNVAQLAKTFGGGGHVKAAGASIYGMSLEEAVNQILNKLSESF